MAASDDEDWLYIQSDHGVTGWLTIDNKGVIQNGERVHSGDLFSGLCNAD